MSRDHGNDTPYEQRQWSCRLDGDPQGVITARALTTAVLRGWDADLVEDAVLVTNELVTNAIADGAAHLTVRNEPEPPMVIGVTGASPELPVQQLPGEVGHFGLWISEELARVTIHPGPTRQDRPRHLRRHRPSLAAVAMADAIRTEQWRTAGQASTRARGPR